MVSPIRAWRRLCAFIAAVCIAAINFAIVYPTATLAWTPTTPQVSVSTFGGTRGDVAQAIALDSTGNMYTAGFFSGTADFDPGTSTTNLTSAGSDDVFVSKLDSSGNFVWAKSFGGSSWDYATAVAVDSTGNVYTTGYFIGTVDFDPGDATANLISAGDIDVFILKLDSSGNFVWAKRLGGDYMDLAAALAIDSTGNVYTTGYFTRTADFDPGNGTSYLSSNGGAAVFVSKLDSSGIFVWAKRFSGGSNDNGTAIAVDSTGNVYTTGKFMGGTDFDPGGGSAYLSSTLAEDVFVSKLDSSGNFVWAKSFGGSENDVPTAVAVDSTGNVYTAGYFRSGVDFDPGAGTSYLPSAGSDDVFVSKLNSSGNFVWAKRLGSSGLDRASSVAIDSTGNVYTTGYFEGTADFDPGPSTSNLSSAGSHDAFVSKLDSSGNFVWAKSFGGISSDATYAAALDGAGNVYTAGFFGGTVDFDPGTGTSNLTSAGSADAFVLKLDSSGGSDLVAPTVSWTEPSSPSASRTLSYTLVFNKSVTGLAAGDFSNTGTATGCVFTPAGSSGVTLTVSVVCGSDGTVVARLAADAVTASGMTGPVAGVSASTVTIDTVVPSVSWTEPSSPSTSRTLSYTLVFNRSVTGLAAGDFSNTGTATGCVFTPASSSGSSVVVSVVCSSDGTVVARLDADAVTASGMTGPVTSVSASSVTIDTVVPSVSWTEPSSPSSSRTLSYTLVFNRSVTGLAAVDFSNTGTATGCMFTPASSSGSSVVVSVVCSSDGTVVARLAADAVTASGMTGPVTSVSASTVTIDTVVPSVSWTEPSSPSSSRTLSYTLVFNRSVTGLVAGDFSNTGTATGCVFTPSASSGVTLTVSVVCSSDGTVIARLAADAVTASGMAGPDSGVSASSVTIDTVPASTTTIPTSSTTLGNTTATTVASAPVVTVAVGQVSVATIAPALAGTTTTSTTVSSARASITATTTTTTVQSTIPVPIATVAPAKPSTKLSPMNVPDVSRGGAALRVGGKEVPLKISRLDNRLLLSAANFDAAFSGVRPDGAVVPLDTDGNIRLDKGDAIRIAVTGFAAGSQVEIRLYSDPLLLGMGAVSDEGTLTEAYQIPDTVPAGAHRVVLAGKNYSGDAVMFTVGIVLGAQESASGLVRALIAIPILLAVSAGLFLPAFLRRRKRPASA